MWERKNDISSVTPSSLEIKKSLWWFVEMAYHHRLPWSSEREGLCLRSRVTLLPTPGQAVSLSSLAFERISPLGSPLQALPTNWGSNCSPGVSLTPQTELSLGSTPSSLSACLFPGLPARLNFSRCCHPNPALINSICSPLLCHCFLVTLLVLPAVICVPGLSHLRHLHLQMTPFTFNSQEAASVYRIKQHTWTAQKTEELV